MQQLAQQLQHTNQLLTNMQDRVHSLEQERARRVSIATDTVDETRNLGFGHGPNMSSSSQSSSLVDTRSLGEPEFSKVMMGSVADWAFIFKSYVGCIAQEYIPLMEGCEQSRVPMVNRSLGPSEQGLSGQLCYILVMLFRGRALDIAHNCGVGEGF